MKGILITGGEKAAPELLRKILTEDTVLAAVDSGIDWALENSFSPDFFAGDMDSIKSTAVLDKYPEARIFRFPSEKDETDTEIGMRILRQNGCSRITVWGGGGGRMDHFLAIVSLFERADCPEDWYTAHEHFRVIRDSLEIRNGEGRRLSLFPLGCETCRMTSKGLKWPLDELIWNKGDFGLSNIIDNNNMIIEIKHGKLLLVIDLGEADRP